MLTAGALALASSSASAADDTATRDAEARFAEGLSRVKKQDYEGARLSFAQAYTVLHRPLILWNLALSEEKSGHPLDALGHFRQVSHEAASEADRTSAQKHVDGLLAKTSRIEVQAPTGTSFVLDGAEVVATAPLGDALDVMPGHHVVVAKLTAGANKTSEVDAIAGQVAHVSFVADAPPPPVVAAAPTPAAAPAQALPDTPSLPDTTNHPFWTARTVTAVVLAGGAAVAAGFGIGFGVASSHNKTTADGFRKTLGQDGCFTTTASNGTECSAFNDAVNSQNRDANISDALYFTGGVFAVGAILSWYFWPKHTGATADTWVMPEVGQGRAGVGAGGRF
jgi:hypothetical protein